MNFRTTYLLFGLLAAVLVVFGVALWKLNPEAADPSAYVLPSLHDPAHAVSPGDIDKVELARAEPRPTLAFERDPQTKRWRATQPRACRASTPAVTGLIRQAVDARRMEIQDRPAKPEDWGLGDPPATGTLTLRKGEEAWWVKLGSVSPGTQSAAIYVASSDRPQEPVAVRRRELDDVLKDLKDFRDTYLLTSSSTDIQSVKLSQGPRPPVALKKGDEGRWRYAEPAYGDAEMEGAAAAAPGADQTITGVRPLLTALANLQVQDRDKDFVEDDAKDLAKYGLDPSKDQPFRIEITQAEEGKEHPSAV